MSFKVKDKFSPPRSDHQTVNLFQNVCTVEQLKKRWYKSSEQVSQKEHLSETLKPILNNLSFINKIKFSILYWKDQTYVSLAIQYGREIFLWILEVKISYQLFQTIRSFRFVDINIE